MTFGDSNVGSIGDAPLDSSTDCIMGPGEFIHTIQEEGDANSCCQKGLLFVTTQKTCGPYGQMSVNPHEFRGNRLMYIEGRQGGLFDQFAFVFDVCN